MRVATLGVAMVLILASGPALAQSLLNNGNQPGGNGGIIGSQGPGYSSNPRDRYVPGQNNQTPSSSQPNYGQQSGSTSGGQRSGSMYGSQPR